MQKYEEMENTNHGKPVDIHVVSRNMSPELVLQLLALGFQTKTVAGGDPRVCMEHLLSIVHDSVELSDAVFSETIALCQQDKSFFGYVEQEVIVEDMKIRTDQIDTPKSLDLDLAISECPDDLYKACDLHFAFVDVGERIRHELDQAGFYNLVLNKPKLGDVTVFTMQFEKVSPGHALWNHMMAFLRSQPGMNIDAKFEVTRNLKRFGDYPLPPLILKEDTPIFGHEEPTLSVSK